jgi:hypothetical protein
VDDNPWGNNTPDPAGDAWDSAAVWDYARIREEARSSGRTVDDLLAMTDETDPFYAGRASRQRDGAWFADLWQRLAIQDGTHLRFVHYRLVSRDEPWLRPDGQPYLNTEKDWTFLNTAAANARYLGLIDPRVLEDHRSPEPRLYATSRALPTPSWSIADLEYDWDTPSLPEIDLSRMNLDVALEAPTPLVTGYDYLRADQPYYPAVWVEKSTMDDILVPICERLGVDLQTGIGYLSITRITQHLERIAAHGKPARIFYLSDFDPSGENMPLAVARQAEFWFPTFCPGAELKVQYLTLTAEQAARYNLPRSPIKEGHSAKDALEARHGQGATELDALEALVPGELARILEEAIEPYLDDALPGRLRQAGLQAGRTVQDAWEEAIEDEAGELEEIVEEAEQIIEPYQREIERPAKRMATELAPLDGRLQEVWCVLRDKVDILAVDLPARPTSELAPPDSEANWLFDSQRDYETQLAFYKQHRPGRERVKVVYAIVCASCGKATTVGPKDARACSPTCQRRLKSARQAARRKQQTVKETDR